MWPTFARRRSLKAGTPTRCFRAKTSSAGQSWPEQPAARLRQALPEELDSELHVPRPPEVGRIATRHEIPGVSRDVDRRNICGRIETRAGDVESRIEEVRVVRGVEQIED